MNRIAFYADAPRPGGHETMAFRMIDVLARSADFEPVLLASPAVLASPGRPDSPTVELPFAGGTPLPFLKNLSPSDVRRASSSLLAVEPDVAVIVQGNIEMGLKGLIGSRMAGLRTVSYLPLAYSFREIGAPLARSRDAVDRIYYRLPHGFVTVSEAQAARIRHLAEVRVHIVTNPVDAQSLDFAGDPRSPGDGPEGGLLQVGIVGRVYLRQKNQDVLVKVAALARGVGQKLCVHVIGGGPDLERLAGLAREAGLTEAEFRIHGHMERRKALEFVATRIDVLVIPSRFEGVPLVLLEAAATGKPFLAARREFTAEYDLPPECLVDPENPNEILQRLHDVRNPTTLDRLADARERILKRHAPERFKSEVLRAFASLVEA